MPFKSVPRFLTTCAVSELKFLSIFKAKTEERSFVFYLFDSKKQSGSDSGVR